jgi:hypothetical protein
MRGDLDRGGQLYQTTSTFAVSIGNHYVVRVAARAGWFVAFWLPHDWVVCGAADQSASSSQFDVVPSTSILR